MSEIELPERSLFAKVEEPEVEEPLNEDQEMILDLLDERDQLRARIQELEDSNTWKLLAMIGMSALYACIMIAVVDIQNNPEL